MLPTDRFVAESVLWVRYAETDAMRIVHHSQYLVYFEEARSEYMRQRGESYARFEADGFYLAVTDVHVRYARPAVYGQQIRLRCWITDVQSRGMRFGYQVTDAASGEVHATGETRHVCLSRDGAVSMIPGRWRDWASASTVVE